MTPDAVLLDVDVVGVPQPQGSAKAYRRGRHVIVTHDNPQLHSWRDLIGYTLRATKALPRLAVPRVHPVRVTAEFRLPRPKSRAKARAHVTKPDLDKLTRAVGDALEALVYTSDSQITCWQVSKRYVVDGEQPGVRLRVAEVFNA